MLSTVRHILEMIRFSHTLFALPFALLAAVMAWHATYLQVRFYNLVAETDERMLRATPVLEPILDETGQVVDRHVQSLIDSPDHPLYHDPPAKIDAIRWQELLGLLFCMAAARSYAMSINRLADRRLDAENPRTAGRHLPAGTLNVRQVTAFAAASAIVFVVSTLLFLPNWLPIALSVPVLAFLAGYSYAKRFTWLAHAWLGAALGLSPIAAWIAIRGTAMFENPLEFLPPLVLGGAVLTWVTGFDIIYACQDFDADRRAQLHSIPVRLGVPAALRVAAVCHVITIVLLACLPLVYPPFGWIYSAGVVAVAGLLVYEHLLVRPDDLSRVNVAFFRVNAIISLGLFAVGTLDLWVGSGGY